MDAVQGIEAKNVLLQSSPFDDREREVCARLLAEPDPDTIVGVTTAATPDQWISSHLDRTRDPPADVQLVCVGEHTRAGATTGIDGGWSTSSVSTSTVNDPANLTRLGTTLTDCLSTDSSAGGTVLCLDSISTLLQHAEPRAVFQFLHVLTDLVATNDVDAHYHVDPSAHDDQDIASIKHLFTAVITITGDGVEVQTR